MVSGPESACRPPSVSAASSFSNRLRWWPATTPPSRAWLAISAAWKDYTLELEIIRPRPMALMMQLLSRGAHCITVF